MHSIPRIYLAVFCCVLLVFSCRNHPQRFEIGSKKQTDSAMQPRDPLFESGRLLEAQHFVDSAFFKRSSPTVFDHLAHYNTNAYVNGTLGNYVAQLRYLDSAVTLVEAYLPNKELSVELSTLLIGRGTAYFNLKNYPASFQQFFEATQAVKAYPDTCTTSFVVYSIGMILYKQQQFQESADYFKECLPWAFACEKIEAYRNNRLQEILDNIGLCYTKLKRYDSAMHYYQRALDLVLQNPNKMAIDTLNSHNRYRAAAGVIMGNMAKIYVGTNRPDSAIALYKRALSFNTNIDVHDRQLCLVQLTDVYLSANALQPAHETLQELGKSLAQIPAKDLETDYNRLQYAYFSRTKAPTKALAALTTYMQLRDSATAQQAGLQQTDISRELREREQAFKIQLLQKDNEAGKTYLWLFGAIAVMAVVILALIYTYYFNSKMNVRRLMEMNTAITDANHEKDRILRVVAHDLRNPIGAISTLSQLLTVGDFDKQKTTELLQSIESLSRSAITLINDLMIAQQSTSTTEEERAPTDLKQLLQQAVMVLQFKANEKGQQLNVVLPDYVVFANVYPVKMERVINNLLANAIKFSPVNGAIEVLLEQRNKTVRLSVRDHGVGIPPENIHKVFDQFTTIKRPGTAGEKSFGLGLSICKQIVERMNGKIWVESVVGKGSTFFVELPAE